MRLNRLFTYWVLGAWTFVCVFPLYWVAITSLKSEADITSGPVYLPFADFMPSLKAWSFILADPYDNLLPRYFNSAVVALSSTVLTMSAGGLAVYSLTRFRRVLPFMDNRTILSGVLASRVLPPAVLVIPVYIMAQHTGTLDTRFALIVCYAGINLPVAVWLLQPVLGYAATDQEQAAQIDGASHFQIFFTILVPMVAGGVAAVSMLILVLCWNEYLFAVYLAADHAMTLPPWMVGQMSMKEAQAGSEAEEWANLSAATVFMVAPMLVCTALVQKALSRMTMRSQ